MKGLLILFLILLLLACGGKKSKKESSTEYLYFNQAFKVVDQIRLSYQLKDNEGIRKHTTESAYKDIVSSIKPFDRAELEFTPVLVEIEGDNVKLYVSWNGKWSYLGKDYEERGLVNFLLRGNPPKVEKIIRGNPFKFPD